MKKLFLIALTAFTLVSCKKDETTTAALGLTAKVNGNAVNYGTLYTQKQMNNGVQFVSVQGVNGSETMSVIVGKSGTVTPGVYNLPDATVMQINGTNGTSYATTSTVTVTITAIDETHVEGTFSGTLDDMSSNGGASKTITEGKFNAKF